MYDEDLPEPQPFQIDIKPLFNSPEMSDVRFLVDGQTVYGHKFVLAMGSPVFKSMFYGELKEQREVIEIKDLTSVGFKNALRYIYGFKIDFELAEIYESFTAADKYLLNDFHETFFDYIIYELNAESCCGECLIYAQLFKIGERVDNLLFITRAQIIESSWKAFESEHFAQIDQETLISLLSPDQLAIAEFDLLVAVLKWVDCEVQRQGLPVNGENRRRVFEPIKGYILFAALTPEEIASEVIRQLLTDEERESLLLHQPNGKNPSTIELKTVRRAGSERSIVVTMIPRGGPLVYPELTRLSATRRVCIQTIHTTFSKKAQDLRLKVLSSTGADLGLKVEHLVEDLRFCFSFSTPFVMEPNNEYTLQVTGDGQMTEWGRLYKATRVSYDETIYFDFPDHEYNWILGFAFCLKDL